MNFRDLAMGAYIKLHDAIASKQNKLLISLLGFEHPAGDTDFIYDWQERDFTRELVNAFNQYAYWVDRIATWEQVLKEYSEDEAQALRYEFTTIPFDYCLHFPYKFRSRLIFYATQLCYTKGIAENLITQEEVKADDDINFASFRAIAHHWPAGLKFKEDIKLINGEAFRQHTSSYRNKSQHQHAQRLDFGYTAHVSRDFPDGSLASYSFGEMPPIAASTVLPILVAEAEKMRTGFHSYRALVEAHIGVMLMKVEHDQHQERYVPDSQSATSLRPENGRSE